MSEKKKHPCDDCEHFRLEWCDIGRCDLTGRLISLNHKVICKRRKNNA